LVIVASTGKFLTLSKGLQARTQNQGDCIEEPQPLYMGHLLDVRFNFKRRYAVISYSTVSYINKSPFKMGSSWWFTVFHQ